MLLEVKYRGIILLVLFLDTIYIILSFISYIDIFIFTILYIDADSVDQ